MAGADSGTVVPVEILVEQNHVAPVRICLKFIRASVYWPTAVGITQKDPRKPARDFGRNLAQVHHLARSCGALNLEAVAKIVMKLLQRFDDQIVEWKPDGTTPI